MPFPIIPAVATAANFFSSLFNTAQQRKQSKYNTDATILANKQMAEYAYSKDQEMWNRQNLYNTPSAQMQRLKDAGLNPNLIYGKGSAGTGNASVMPKYTAPRQDYSYKPIQIPQIISQYQDIAMKNAQIDNISAQATNTKLDGIVKQWLNKPFTQKTWDDDSKTMTVIKNQARFKQLWESKLGISQAQADYSRTRANINALEYEWWKSLKGIKGAEGIGRILRLFRK